MHRADEDCKDLGPGKKPLRTQGHHILVEVGRRFFKYIGVTWCGPEMPQLLIKQCYTRSLVSVGQAIWDDIIILDHLMLYTLVCLCVHGDNSGQLKHPAPLMLEQCDGTYQIQVLGRLLLYNLWLLPSRIVTLYCTDR